MKRSRTANKNGIFKDEIVEVQTKESLIKEDEELKKEINESKLKKLNSSFIKNGTVTAGNSSLLSDGACAILLTRYFFYFLLNIYFN
jgi:acetyl-CoA acetyltransferase